jgi:hypothetical protein
VRSQPSVEYRKRMRQLGDDFIVSRDGQFIGE